MLNLKRFRSRDKGLADLLNYAALIAPGIVLCKDGALLGGFSMNGRDMASSTPEELEFVSEQFNLAVKLLGSGWMLHVDAVRSRYDAYSRPDESHFPDPVSKLIDEERREFFSGGICYRTKTVLILSYKPDVGADKMAARAQTGGGSSLTLERSLEQFETALAEFEDALAGILRLTRLGDTVEEDEFGNLIRFSELLSHLQLCLTGIEQPVRVPGRPMYLDALLGSEELIGGLTPRIGNQRIAVLSLDGLPQESWPAMLSVLDGLQLPYRFSSRFICLDQLDAAKEINSYRKGWQQNVFKFVDKFFSLPNARPNRDAARMVEDAEESLVEVQGGYVGAGFLTSCIILLHDDPIVLAEWTRELRRTLLTMGFGCRIETINALDAWLGTHPGNGFANLRRPMVNTLNLADLLPLSTIWSGDQTCPCPFYPASSPALMVCTTDGSTPFWLNLHVHDIGHTLIFGPTGSGKSTLLALIAAQFRRYDQAQVFAFDKGMSLFPLCAAVGGTHHEIGRSEELAFAPLQHVDDASEQAWAEEWIATLLELQGVLVTPRARNDIHAAMTLLRESPAHMRSLSDFSSLVQDQRIKEGLQHYTRAGAMGFLLDAETDQLGLSPFMVFEIEDLMNMGEKNLIPVLLYLFHRIERALKGQPAIIVVDESWVAFGHAVFRAKLRELLKVLRKANCAVIMATQSLSDAKGSGILDVLVESCPTKIFLPNITARQEVQANLYTEMGLNGRQIEIIASAVAKRDYYVVTPNGSRLIQLALGKKAMRFVGASDKESLNNIKVLQEQLGDKWPDAWLNRQQWGKAS
ncbi:CagE, TrbE, VirB component of type IV transporter system, conserved region [Solidesulfovibrio carbinoliphilus subsp. oakridgensis]|uniref:CagE, TrbE, VirB component of type IV transporter system, conserved region n=1 Tax=Solidesulfovibrio carbinoliphilus subsp. oakridgensis TaxID=694327 RepID=G7QB63_9BACT|nr:conjugal transfer protein TrbE [Solidesulfovibrio carbinoliphilus]EHJ48805.1 CagE, TrbE, VirB component of type IV transporter system, conserved region [Solidesulfovibrio carbinoliphilus subsp. oakridgensis]